MENTARPTPADMVPEFGPTLTPTGQRCRDDRPIFQGSNGHTACACDDH